MVTFNENDANIGKIKKDSKLFNLSTKLDYKIYGLRQQDNPLIDLTVYGKPPVNLEVLKNFFNKNNIQINVDTLPATKRLLKIGLRRDLRDHTTLSCAIIQTIVYFFEKRVNLNKDFKIPGIPKFSEETIYNK